MRILMLTDSFYPEVGGSETAIWRLSEALVDKGHTVGVAVISRPMALNPSKKFQFWNLSSRVGPLDMKFLGKIRNLRNVIRTFKPDVLNVHFMLESGYVGVHAARAEHIPCVLTNRGKGLYNEPTNMTERIMFPFWNRGSLKADRYLATSQEMVDRMQERYGINSLAISNGVDTGNFTPTKDGKYIRERHGVREGQSVIFCARRLVPKNGIEYMVRALPKVREKMDAVLWLASPLIREYEKLKALSKELGVEDAVKFLGSIDHHELPHYFAAADLVVQPSIAEARSLACLEAMASGAAIVATATGGLAELITHGENGYLVDAFQESTYAVSEVFDEGVRHLADAVITVLSDDVLRAKLQKGARAYAETCSWPEIAEQTLKTYREAMEQWYKGSERNKQTYGGLHDHIIKKRFQSKSSIRRYVHRAQYRAIVESIPSGSTVLDAGCGEGVLSVLLAKKGCQVTGVDLSIPNIKAAEQYAMAEGVGDCVQFLVGDAERLPVPGHSFDYVVSSHVLEHLPDFLKGVNEIERTMKIGAVVAIPTCLNPCAWVLLGGDHYWAISRHTPYAIFVGFLRVLWALLTGQEGVDEGYAGRKELHHIRRFPWRGKKLLEQGGLTVLSYRASSFPFPYIPLLLPLSRLLQRFASLPFLKQFGFGATYICEPVHT